MPVITLVSPGKIKQAWLNEAINTYVKRLSRYCQVRLITVRDEPDQRPLEEALKREGQRLLGAVTARSWVVALDPLGKTVTSEQFSHDLMGWLARGHSQVFFLIGGDRGLDPQVLQAAHQVLSLSRMTWTHQMSRLLLLEQCYRAFRIQSGEPYHK